MRLSDDISRQIGELFAEPERAPAEALLLGAKIHDGSTAECRLQRCALVASKGSLERLKYYVGLGDEVSDGLCAGRTLQAPSGAGTAGDIAMQYHASAGDDRRITYSFF